MSNSSVIERPATNLSKVSIRDVPLRGKRLFMRVDFNVPLTNNNRVADDTRIRETLPTIVYALNNDACVILASHLGRPKGKVNPKYSLRPVAEALQALLDEQIGCGKQVGFSPDCIGVEADELKFKLKPGEILLLENSRFHPEEEGNDENFARELAKGIDIYVNDAFGTAHRAHASTVGITRFVQKSASGLLMENELKYLGKALQDPERPFVTILGGAKVSDKIGVIKNLIDKVDALLIGGGMAYTFLKAQGLDIGKSLVEEDKLELAKQILRQAAKARQRLCFQLPVDHLVAPEISETAKKHVIPPGMPIPVDQMALDIGPRTIEIYQTEINKARTIVWNGPMGVFETEQFAGGTKAIAYALAANKNAMSIVGGGDTASAVKMAGVTDQITHISTGGGASLEFLEGMTLPGVAALTDRQ